jgi:hypothetical protein
MASFTYGERAGEPYQIGELTITPISKVLLITPPGAQGGLIWNHPTAVRVKHLNGEEQVLPVPDPTLQAILLLTAFSLAALLAFLFAQFQKRKLS